MISLSIKDSILHSSEFQNCGVSKLKTASSASEVVVYLHLGMKKWSGGLLITALALILFLSYTLIGRSEPSKKQSAYDFFNPHHHPLESDLNATAEETIRSKPHLTSLQELDDLYSLSRNLSRLNPSLLLAWAHLKFLFPRSDALPLTDQGIKEALVMCRYLLSMIQQDEEASISISTPPRDCPAFVNTADANSLEIPCGLVQDSSVTVIGIPDDNFQIQFIGSLFEGTKPPVVLQYNIVLPGENLTKEPLVVQNAWTQESGWGKEERCPDHAPPARLQVDGLVKCNTQIITSAEESLNTTGPTNTKPANVSHEGAAFQFVEGNPFIATFWAGGEGFHTTVNGRHETSFAYRERLEPWLVNRVEVKGGLSSVSILAKGLPVSDGVDLVGDTQKLKAASLSHNRKLLLLIGVFSSGNNFERRMALRRTWMQYDAVRSGQVAVRFFIGLHKNKEVNLKVWREGEKYGDIELMPFVDYYSLLTYKTIAICILGTKIVSARFVMKMDDDAFVRIDEVLSRLEGKGETVYYGRISYDAAPNRDKDNKWFISEEEWPHSSYPPWAHGPGYILSNRIAQFIVAGHQDRDLMLFKLEDVAVGIWIEQYGKKKGGQQIEYVNDDRFNNAGCESDYILAHYQNPRMMLCLWEILLKHRKPECCDS